MDINAQKNHAFKMMKNTILSIISNILKEKDEKSSGVDFVVSNLAAILDLTVHSHNLTATHQGKQDYLHQDLRYNLQPALFTRLCTFLV